MADQEVKHSPLTWLRPEQYARWLRDVDDPEWTEHRYRDNRDRAIANAIPDLRDTLAAHAALTERVAELEKALRYVSQSLAEVPCTRHIGLRAIAEAALTPKEN